MFTKQFKTVLVVVALIVICALFAYNQYKLQLAVTQLQSRPVFVVTTPTPLPTEEPTATPTATLKNVFQKPVVPSVTKAVK